MKGVEDVKAVLNNSPTINRFQGTTALAGLALCPARCRARGLLPPGRAHLGPTACGVKAVTPVMAVRVVLSVFLERENIPNVVTRWEDDFWAKSIRFPLDDRPRVKRLFPLR